MGTTTTIRRQNRAIRTIFAGIVAIAVLALFHNDLPDAKSVGGLGLIRVVADGNDDEAQLQQQLQAQQQMQQAEQQAEEQEQLANQQAQQAEQQGLQVEQQATLSVPGS
jgi:Sec-independent protein translocase protein TatA